MVDDRGQKSSIRHTMASSFDALPTEIVQKCVEFLDFDLVSGDLKAVWTQFSPQDLRTDISVSI